MASFNSSRNYGIDALRIISMLMVVTLHILHSGGILDSAKAANYWIVWFIEVAAYGAVDCYALISGYVGVYSKYKVSNLVLLWCRVAFYSIIITVIFKAISPGSVSTRSLVSAFFPTFSKQYWYFTSYAFMFLFIPAMNEGIKRLSKNKLRFMLVSLIVISSVFYPFIKYLFGDIFYLDSGYSPLWLMIVYLIGGYIRKYGFAKKIKAHRTAAFLALYLAFAVITWLSKVIIQLITARIGIEGNFDRLLINYQSITVLASAVCLFLALERLNFKAVIVKIIAFFSPLAFSVYLIHENIQVREQLIKNNFTWVTDLPPYLMIPVIFLVIAGVFLLCAFIDLIRHYLFRALKLKQRLERLEDKIKKKLKKSNA